MQRPHRSLAWVLPTLLIASCASPRFHSTDEELERFLAAGPVTPQFDAEALIASLDPRLHYEIGPGDLLSIEIPTAAISETPATPSFEGSTVLRRRVKQNGTVTLPVVGEVEVLDTTYDAAEEAIAGAFHPAFLRRRPAVVVQLVEGQTYPVTVVGTVAQPGRHRLQRNELTLTDALAAAGGISAGTGEFAIGARGVRIYKPGQEVGKEVVLPVRHLNVPMEEVFLEGGERIEVVRYEPQRFAVLGLVQQPGVFEFPVETDLNLMEAIAQASGLDPISSPPYATVFRQEQGSDEVLASTFDLRKPLESALIQIHPGDIVHVDYTAGTWTRFFLSQSLRLQVGGQANLLD